MPDVPLIRRVRRKERGVWENLVPGRRTGIELGRKERPRVAMCVPGVPCLNRVFELAVKDRRSSEFHVVVIAPRLTIAVG